MSVYHLTTCKLSHCPFGHISPRTARALISQNVAGIVIIGNPNESEN